MTRRSWWRAVAAVGVVLAAAMPMAASTADEGPYPGLPPAEPQTPPRMVVSWGGAAMNSIGDVQKARQWMRTPLMVSAFDLSGGGAPNPDPALYTGCSAITANVYFVAEPGAEHAYGLTPAFTVRTVAFGAIPVEATVRLEQRRTEADLPVPLKVSTRTCARKPSGIDVPDMHITDVLSTRVTRLVVDGVPVRLGDRCRTTQPGALSLFGRGYSLPPGPPHPFWESGYFNVSPGGLLTGTLDVPAFTGCVTEDGDDLSRLLTATVSGEDYPLRTFQGSAFGCSGNKLPNGKNGPPPPGASTVETAKCSTALNQVPPLIDIPTVGSQPGDGER